MALAVVALVGCGKTINSIENDIEAKLADNAPGASASVRGVRTPDQPGEWAVLGSNQRPPACRAGALPTELTARGVPRIQPALGRTRVQS